MQIVVILIVVAIVIAVWFAKDVVSTGSAVKKQGGMKKKYEVLLQHFLRTPGTKIHSESSSGIVLSSETERWYNTLVFEQINETLVVKWIASNTLGKFTKEWMFHENENQTGMAVKMGEEMGEYLMERMAKGM